MSGLTREEGRRLDKRYVVMERTVRRSPAKETIVPSRVAQSGCSQPQPIHKERKPCKQNLI